MLEKKTGIAAEKLSSPLLRSASFIGRGKGYVPESAALAGMLKAEQEDKEEEDLKDLIGEMELDEAAAAVAFREAIAHLSGVLEQAAKAAEEAAAKAAKAEEEAKQRREQDEGMDHAWSVLEDRLAMKQSSDETVESLAPAGQGAHLDNRDAAGEVMRAPLSKNNEAAVSPSRCA